MIAHREALERSWHHAREIGRRRTADPVRYIRWLPLQHEFLSDIARVKQIRTGNQTIGKTTAALAEIIGRCLGRHPLGEGVPHNYRVPPIEAWVICASWSQSLGIQAKLNALLPWPEVAERTSYDAVAGFTPTKSPIVQFRNGSIIRIKTTGQDAIDFAGATIAAVLFDEPPKQPRMYTEALMRLEELGGVLLLSYTPINAPVDYLRELVDEGQIRDHWRPLTPAELIPVGCSTPLLAKDGRPKDAAWIAEREAKVPSHERPVVVHGEWETQEADAYFGDVFRRDVHVHRNAPEDEHPILCLGIDHGHRPGKQIAHLVVVTPPAEGSDAEGPSIYVVDSYVDHTGTATPSEDAKGILAMLERHGQRWLDLESAWGDRVHMSGKAQQKSNLDLMGHLAKRCKVKQSQLRPEIRTVKQGPGQNQGSVGIGLRWLHHAFVQDRIGIHPRCVQLIEALGRYRRAAVDEYADPIDALRYALHPYIFHGRTGPVPTVRFR